MSYKENNYPLSEIRLVENINSGWKFAKLSKKAGSAAKIEAPGFDDSLWQPVSLPHTWNDFDGADHHYSPEALTQPELSEGYYRGLGGYRKSLSLPESFENKRVFIEFDGVNTIAMVYINGEYVGSHEGGYSAFRFDITDYVRPGKVNLIAVKADNSPSDHIVPITNQGDFTKMGGIYRSVKLIAADPLHIDMMDYGSPGIYITPCNISANHSDVNFRVLLANDSPYDKKVTVSARITDPYGKEVEKLSVSQSLAAGQRVSRELNASVESPCIWNGVSSPLLYSAEITLTADEAITDCITQSFGIRSCMADPEKGFILNGVPTRLKGVNYHQDSFENGWAMENSQFERDYRLMLEMGVNSVRMAHYQHNPYEYSLCDRLGITVWTEIGLINRITADESGKVKILPKLKENLCQQLNELIRQNYNHPSIIFWGICNELYQMNDEIYGIFSELCSLARNIDPCRLITFADNQSWGKFLELPSDVVGCNRYFGWYKEAGEVEKLSQWLDNYHKNNPSRPLCISEYGGGGAISQFMESPTQDDINPWGSPHYLNYQSLLHEKLWAQLNERKYLFGCYIWCIFDFASAGRKEGDTVGQNDKGLVTRKRTPKDAYYFYKSVWNDEPTLHLTEKAFTPRNRIVPKVKAYSNCESAELFVNGISKGIILRSHLDPLYSTVFTWNNVEILPDRENEVKVKSRFADGSILEDSAFWSCK